MSSQPAAEHHGRRAADDTRQRLLAGTPTGIIMQGASRRLGRGGHRRWSTLGTLGAAGYRD
jgi:hypothetical protein